MNALATLPALHIEDMADVHLVALMDQIYALVHHGDPGYSTSGPGHIRHRSGRRMGRTEAAETLSFHHMTLAEAKASERLITATRRIAADLERAMRESFEGDAS